MKSMGKKLILFAVSLFVSLQTYTVFASETGSHLLQDKEKKEKKEKVKKEKKPFSWPEIRPEKLSGNTDMDAYILFCDTVWNRVTTYRDSITFFKVDTAWKMAGADTVKVLRITDQNDNPRNFSSTLLQYLQYISAGTSLLSDGLTVNLKATTAGTSFLSNPLLAFSYTKCLKAGPLLAVLVKDEASVILKKTKAQAEDIKRMKGSAMEGSTDLAIILAKEEGEVPTEGEIANLDKSSLGDPVEGVGVDTSELDNLQLD